jgi:hypothetical protein
MKKTVNLFSATMLSMSLLLMTSCSKDDGGSGTPAVSQGQAHIKFNSSAAIIGGTSFNPSSVLSSNCASVVNGNLRTVNLSVTEVAGTTAKIVSMTMVMPSNSSTSGGNITVPLHMNNGGIPNTSMTISQTNTGSGAQEIWLTTEGTATITTLNATDIVGTFTGKAITTANPTGVNITNGAFTGKFR